MIVPPSTSVSAVDTPPQYDVGAQSLARGAAGTALLHIARAQAGQDSWHEAHRVLAACTHDLIADQRAALYLGAPAVAFALHTAATTTGGYSNALQALDETITHLTHRRLEAARARIDRGQRPRPQEYDLFYGITGLGTYLLCRDPTGPTTRTVLSYLVRLTLPLPGDDGALPGWWTPLAPSGQGSPQFPGGHGNLGTAHGIAGPLALLSLAARRGTVVDGHLAAIERICAWLDRHRQDATTGPWWPYWVTRAEHSAGTVASTGPLRPSWCYGTPGLARAQQLAGIVLGDAARQRLAEHAMHACLADHHQLARIRDAGICHGAAGLLQSAHRIAEDAPTGAFTTYFPRLRSLLLEHAPTDEHGFLDGPDGVALALLTSDTNSTTPYSWDACLLLTA